MPKLLLVGRGSAQGAASSREPWQGRGCVGSELRYAPCPFPRSRGCQHRSARAADGSWSSWSFSRHQVEEKFTWSSTEHRLLSGMGCPVVGWVWGARGMQGWGCGVPSQPRSWQISQAADPSCPIIPPASVTVCRGSSEPSAGRAQGTEHRAAPARLHQPPQHHGLVLNCWR